MEEKSTGKTVVIIILTILLIGALGYIVYDKVIVQKNEEPTPTEKNIKTNILSNEEALSLGKEKYEYIRNGMYMCGYKQLVLSQDAIPASTIGGDTTAGYNVTYREIANINDIKSNLTAEMFNQFVSSKLITHQDKYYIVDGCGGDPTYAHTEYKIETKNIQEDSITYTITEYFYNMDNSGNIVEDLNKAENYTATFAIIKENDNWKISQYEDAYTSYINKKNNH